MSRFQAQATPRHTLTKVAGAIGALGVHLAVLAAIIASPPPKPQMEMDETVDVRFVEISDEIIDAAPVEEPVPEPVVEPEPEPEPEPVVEEPEPVIEPEPEPVVEPEPEPEPVVEEPEPEAITPPPPPPKPKPEPKPKPKPKPEPKPKPKPKPKPQPKPVAQAPAGQATAPVPQAPPKPVDPDRPRLIGKVDYLGRRPMPVYPRASERRGEEGRVVVRVLISPQGTVLKATIQKSSGYHRLDDAALDAARSARFRPYTENGIAYRAMADIPFDFVL